MGAENSSEHGETKECTKDDVENGLPIEVKIKEKLEASTQTDAIEDDGFDMRTPMRQRKLFGVVTVVGKAAESTAIPRAEDALFYKSCACVSEVVYRCACHCCKCKWLQRM